MTGVSPEKARARESTYAPGSTSGPTPKGAFHGVGPGVRTHRTAKGLSLRQLARQLGVSASFISQLENGKSQPSVATLVAICEALAVTFDELFAACVALDAPTRVEPRTPPLPLAEGRDAAPDPGIPAPTAPRRRIAPHRTGTGDGPVVHAGARQRLVLDTGVVWEQLASGPDAATDFLLVTYDVGASSTAGTLMSRHPGMDYGYVLSGELTLTLGFETHVIGPTDSISFDANTPHRFHNSGNEPARAVWFVHGDSPQ